MRQEQSGVTLMGLFIALGIIIVVALLAMKLVPAYMEYATAKNAIDAIARERNAQSPQEVRRAVEARAAIDNITAVKPADLEISKDGAGMAIGFAYRREVPLFANLGVYIDFAANSSDQ
jgi:Tfp pilus assembly protein PilE